MQVVRVISRTPRRKLIELVGGKKTQNAKTVRNRMQVMPLYAKAPRTKPTVVNLTGNCVAHYKLNDNAATTTVVDSQGFSNGTAQQNTSALHTTGKIGGALTFNGTSDYVDTGNTFQSVFRDSFTINLFCKVNFTVYSTPFLFGSYSTGLLNGMELFIGPTGYLLVDYRSKGNAISLASNGAVFDDGQNNWKMITPVITRIDALSGTGKLYIDGLLAKESGIFSVVLEDYSNVLSPLIGAVNRDGYIEAFLNGLIDNVMIFNKALSADEIAFLWNGGNGTESLIGVI